MPRILVVEDDVSFREMLRRTLERAGYEVQEAQNGNVALELYRQQPSDLIIMDLVMPEKEGIETILEFRRLNPALKIIAISGGGEMNPKVTLAMAQKLGARRTLAKPFASQELLGAIADVLAELG